MEVKGDKLTLSGEELHKLLCYLEHSVIPKSEGAMSEVERSRLYDFQDELSWIIADMFSYDLDDGVINPNTYKFEKFVLTGE